MDIGKQKLAGHSIVLFGDEIWDALDLQDSFTEVGGRVVTAYRLERALQLAARPSLSAVAVDLSQVTEHASALCRHLAKTQRAVRFL
jgi:hypothetical protein